MNCLIVFMIVLCWWKLLIKLLFQIDYSSLTQFLKFFYRFHLRNEKHKFIRTAIINCSKIFKMSRPKFILQTVSLKLLEMAWIHWSVVSRTPLEQAESCLSGKGWKTPQLHTNATTNLWKNYFSLLISFIDPSRLLSRLGTPIICPYQEFKIHTFQKLTFH